MYFIQWANEGTNVELAIHVEPYSESNFSIVMNYQISKEYKYQVIYV